MNANWPRWIYASCANHFATILKAKGYKVFIEGMIRETELQSDYIEFRLDGPYIEEPSANYFCIYAEIDILIVHFKSADIYAIQRMCGDVMAAFCAIPLYKYGTGDDDNQSQFGCLTLVNTLSEKNSVRVTNFGQMGPGQLMMRSSVDGHYHTQLNG